MLEMPFGRVEHPSIAFVRLLENAIVRGTASADRSSDKGTILVGFARTPNG